MRNLLDKAGEAQSLRVAADPTADISKIEMVDFESVGVPLVRTHVPPPAPPPLPTIPTPAPIVVEHALVPSSPDHLAPRAGRRLRVEATIPPERTLDQALDHLEEMVGLKSVKEEVNKLRSSLDVFHRKKARTECIVEMMIRSGDRQPSAATPTTTRRRAR